MANKKGIIRRITGWWYRFQSRRYNARARAKEEYLKRLEYETIMAEIKGDSAILKNWKKVARMALGREGEC